MLGTNCIETSKEAFNSFATASRLQRLEKCPQLPESRCLRLDVNIIRKIIVHISASIFLLLE